MMLTVNEFLGDAKIIGDKRFAHFFVIGKILDVE